MGAVGLLMAALPASASTQPQPDGGGVDATPLVATRVPDGDDQGPGVLPTENPYAPAPAPVAGQPLAPWGGQALMPATPPPPPRYVMTAERRALLNTIRFSEGTWARGEDLGYRIMFGGGLMPALERHPDRVNYSGGYASAAAGAYQFMPFTWSLASRLLQLRDFGPDAQDQAALLLVERRGALPLADQGAFSPDLAARLAPEWASFPTLAGRSYYGQPVQRYAILRSFYEQNLAALRSQQQPLQPIAQAPACLPQDSLRCRLEALESRGPRPKPLGI